MRYEEIKRYKYRTVQDENYVLAESFPAVDTYWVKLRGNKLWIRRGYAWDGCSGGAPDHKNSRNASLVHDVLYQLMKTSKLSMKYRKNADLCFRDLLLRGGCWRVHAATYYRGVRLGGRLALKRGKKRIIYEALLS